MTLNDTSRTVDMGSEKAHYINPLASGSVPGPSKDDISPTKSLEKEKAKGCHFCGKLTDFIIGKLEGCFYSLGSLIGKHPWMTIGLALLFASFCGIGMIKFTQENRGEKLWNSQDSLAQNNKQWVEERFKSKSFVSNVLYEGSDILTPQAINIALETRKKVLLIYNGTELGWDQICSRQGRSCLTSDLLEIWGFNETIIKALTKADILNAVNKPNLLSPITGRKIAVERFLGQVGRHANNTIVSAKALLSSYFIKNQEVYNTETGKREDHQAQKWETEFGRVIENVASSGIFYFTITAFKKAGSDSIQGDISLLSAGYLLIIVYLSVMLGKFTRIQHKVWLAVAGVACVGLSILVTFGLSSAFGFLYGPLHSILPFLILGIGVDDVFVIVQSWNVVLKSCESDTPVHIIMAKTLKHAGVAISVTSLTDIMAFLVGASTVLPALRSFCVFAGIGIFGVYIFACTLFTAFLTLDTMRFNHRKDACCCCFKISDDYTPFDCATRDYLQWFFDNIVGKYLLKIPVKVAILLMTAALFGVSLYGLLQLKQDFDFNWFLPKESAARKYSQSKVKYFPSEGSAGAVYLGNIDYFKEQANLHQLYNRIIINKYVSKPSVQSWYDNYIKWITRTKANSSNVDNDFRPNTTRIFYSWLKDFLKTREGLSFSRDVLLTNVSGSWTITASRMRFTHVILGSSQEDVKAMDELTSEVDKIPITGKKAFPYSRFYIGRETNKIIDKELFRNLGLAALCVFLVTLFLIANLWTSFMVFTCIIFTLVDVGGMMYFWGLTIDTVTSVFLIVAIGLSVDYAAHIGHSFMTANMKDKTARAAQALSDIGPAVFNGGVSTFLAFVLLGASGSYVFTTFFKVFLLVVLFGQFHGLIYLPMLLSFVGPKPYHHGALQISSKPDGHTVDENVNNIALHDNYHSTNPHAVNPESNNGCPSNMEVMDRVSAF